LQIHAFAGTVEGHLTLLSTTLRADSSMHRRAESFFLAFFADGTTHRDGLLNLL
jgi:hypothetical protein